MPGPDQLRQRRHVAQARRRARVGQGARGPPGQHRGDDGGGGHPAGPADAVRPDLRQRAVTAGQPALRPQHQQRAQPRRTRGRGQGEHHQQQPAPQVPGHEPAGDGGDGRVEPARSGVGVQGGPGVGVALHRAERELRAQRAPHRQPVDVVGGAADLHHLRGPGDAEVGRAGADPDLLAERDDLLGGGQRDGGGQADRQAEQHQRDGGAGPDPRGAGCGAQQSSSGRAAVVAPGCPSYGSVRQVRAVRPDTPGGPSRH